jgi:acetyltransferase-like isoleucine patch superfamily enzyme
LAQITRENGLNRASGPPLQTAAEGPSTKEPAPNDAALGRSPRPERESRIRLAFKALRRISVSRTLYHSARSGGRCIVLRGTRLRLGKGARIEFAAGARLVLGVYRMTASPTSVLLEPGAVLSIQGAVALARGARLVVGRDALLELGPDTYLNTHAAISCLEHIRVGAGSGLSWDTSVFDFNGHDLVIDGVSRPISQPVCIGEHVWVGSRATILPGVTIGDGAVIGAGSVVTTSVPARAVAVGNPARVISQDVTWSL